MRGHRAAPFFLRAHPESLDSRGRVCSKPPEHDAVRNGFSAGVRCYSHLSDDEREQIGLAKALGHSIGTIAHAIGRSKSTISRELCRNRLPSGRYSPLHAAGAYQLRRRREARIERDRALRTFVVDRLAEGWTPEQISGWLKGGNEPRLRAVGCETIYAFIYRAAQQAEQLWRYLTRHHKRRRPRRSRPSQDTIKDRVSIHERPKHVDTRTEAATGVNVAAFKSLRGFGHRDGTSPRRIRTKSRLPSRSVTTSAGSVNVWTVHQ